jgi:hypothetical protein
MTANPRLLDDGGGALGVLSKPYDIDVVLGSIAFALDRADAPPDSLRLFA